MTTDAPATEAGPAVRAAEAAPDAVAPPPRHRRFPLIDGMRAIAVLAVLLVHVSVFAAPNTVPLPAVLMHLNIGLTIFFVISGFLLYRPFIAHRAGGAAAPPVGQYAKRRALRIFPAYWLALSVLTILPGTVGVSGGDWLSQYSLTQTLPFAADAQSCPVTLACGLSHTWSLVVELSFYITLPLWFLLSERLARGRSTRAWVTTELALLAALSILSVALHFRSAAVGLTTILGGTVAGFVLWFALGMALAIASVVLEGRPRPGVVELIGRRPGGIWAAAAAIYVVLCIVLPETPYVIEASQQLWVHLAFALVALLLLLPAVLADDAGGAPRRLLAHPIVAWIGLISYGVFLWHYVVTIELGNQQDGLTFWPLLAATLAISFAAAAASYYALERPVLRLKYRRSSPWKREQRPAARGAPSP